MGLGSICRAGLAISAFQPRSLWQSLLRLLARRCAPNSRSPTRIRFTAARATIPSVSKCMLCHAKIATGNPEVKKVADYAAARREIPWERVYGFDPGALVKFQHAPHIRAGFPCAQCHGDMTQAATAQRLVKHNMGTCLSCHRQNHASEDCATCHY